MTFIDIHVTTCQWSSVPPWQLLTALVRTTMRRTDVRAAFYSWASWGWLFVFLLPSTILLFLFTVNMAWNPLPGTASLPLYWPSTACHVSRWWRWRALRLRATHVLTTALVQRRWGGRWHDDKWSVHWILLSVTSPVSVFPECFQVSISSSSPLSARKVWWRVERECNRDGRGGKKLSLEKFRCAYLGKNIFFSFKSFPLMLDVEPPACPLTMLSKQVFMTRKLISLWVGVFVCLLSSRIYRSATIERYLVQHQGCRQKMKFLTTKRKKNHRVNPL